MGSSIGIWIDNSKARIISPEKIIKTILSNIDTKPRLEGQGKEQGRFGKQYISFEKSKKNKLQHQKNEFLKEVVLEIKPYNQFLIFGPAQMKKELGNLILGDYQLKNRFIELKTTEKMTDKQLIAFVKAFFEK